jgi:hypothetical protein
MPTAVRCARGPVFPVFSVASVWVYLYRKLERLTLKVREKFQ